MLARAPHAGRQPARSAGCASSWGPRSRSAEMAWCASSSKDSPSEFALLREPSRRALLRRPARGQDSRRPSPRARASPSRGARASWTSTAGVRSTRSRAAAWARACSRSPARLGRLVAAMRRRCRCRSPSSCAPGWREGKENVVGAGPGLRGGGRLGDRHPRPHARAALQPGRRLGPDRAGGRGAGRCPSIGNGDILTHYEARERMGRAGVRSVMLGARRAHQAVALPRDPRGARAGCPRAEERFGRLWRFVELLREHFGDDERGRTRAPALPALAPGVLLPLPAVSRRRSTRRRPASTRCCRRGCRRAAHVAARAPARRRARRDARAAGRGAAGVCLTRRRPRARPAAGRVAPARRRGRRAARVVLRGRRLADLTALPDGGRCCPLAPARRAAWDVSALAYRRGSACAAERPSRLRGAGFAAEGSRRRVCSRAIAAEGLQPRVCSGGSEAVRGGGSEGGGSSS